jgi:acetylserotonin O-methyltransferase
MAIDVTKPDPTNILNLLFAFRQSKTMFEAVALGVFDALADGPRTLGELANQFEAQSQALEQLLDACVGMQLLTHREKRYANTAAATAYLTSQSPDRLTGYIHYSNDVMWTLWAHLKDAVKEGSNRWKQAYGWDGPIFSHFFRSEESRREFLMGMHGFGRISSPYVAAAFDLSWFRRLVDLGGATGHFALAACERYPQMEAVVFDLPESMPLAKEIVGASPVGGRIILAPGDFFRDALPEGDLFALGRILHDWSEDKVLRLLGKIYERLPAGGGLLIAEKLLNEDKAGPSWAQMQSLNMLVCTEGKERTLSEYESLLHRVGFRDVQGCRTPSPLDAVLAIKTGSPKTSGSPTC